MTTDLLLAIAHHLLAFSIVAFLFVEFVLVSAAWSPGRVVVLSRVDAGFDGSAMLILIVGFLRVFLGIKPEEFYLESPFFWAKIGALLLMGIVSIAPTLRFLRWAKYARADPSFLPAPAELATVRRFIVLEAVIFLFIPTFAAVMARGYGLG